MFWFWVILRGCKVHCCVLSVLRFLNLKRFPRTWAQVGEGWRRPRCKLHRHSAPRPTPELTRLYCMALCVYVCSESTVVLSHDVFIALRVLPCSHQPLHSTLAIFCFSNMLYFFIFYSVCLTNWTKDFRMRQLYVKCFVPYLFTLKVTSILIQEHKYLLKINSKRVEPWN